MRVPSTMRARPLCAASQLARRCGFVMPLCRLTTLPAPYSGAKRARKRASSCGVRLISGTITSAWAAGSRASAACTLCRYTSVLPLPVLPYSRKGPACDAMWLHTLCCSALSAMVSVVSGASGASCAGAAGRRRRRASCSGPSSRNCGGSAASATSPRPRW
ncbi:hypothetical protein SDC9_150239 [bioreactor metagenome]|uniref:Uncharacterized protein n=1 Tax=bioreactor metagenome TaxID=1076179 RepID=A0A645ENJ4_9ZZZZ